MSKRALTPPLNSYMTSTRQEQKGLESYQDSDYIASSPARMTRSFTSDEADTTQPVKSQSRRLKTNIRLSNSHNARI